MKRMIPFNCLKKYDPAVLKSVEKQSTGFGEKIYLIHLDFLQNDADLKEIPDSGQLALQLLQEISAIEVAYIYLFVEKKRIEYWHETQKIVAYQELVEVTYSEYNDQTPNAKICGCTWKHQLTFEEVKKDILDQTQPLEVLSQKQKTGIIEANQALRLDVLKIPKPWGHEGWYTGVEKRGVSQVFSGQGKVELPYALSLFKKQMLADFPEELLLLKTLNPVAEDVIVDLYLEIHEKKWEVYVVTEIDPVAWPTGVGNIKAGLDAEKISEYQKIYADDWQLKILADFQKAISEYETIRRTIDESTLPIADELTQQEKLLRTQAYDFVGNCPVKVGDIVTFSVYQMHALQHGIKVIEFQTQHYERLIVMFAQKVLTQNHWDTEAALKKMRPEKYVAPQPEILFEDVGFQMERFVDFPQFTVDRIFLDPNHVWDTQLGQQYHLLIVVSGVAKFMSEDQQDQIIIPEESIFVPVSQMHYQKVCISNEPLICLRAIPKISSNTEL